MKETCILRVIKVRIRGFLPRSAPSAANSAPSTTSTATPVTGPVSLPAPPKCSAEKIRPPQPRRLLKRPQDAFHCEILEPLLSILAVWHLAFPSWPAWVRRAFAPESIRLSIYRVVVEHRRKYYVLPRRPIGSRDNHLPCPGIISAEPGEVKPAWMMQEHAKPNPNSYRINFLRDQLFCRTGRNRSIRDVSQ